MQNADEFDIFELNTYNPSCCAARTTQWLRPGERKIFPQCSIEFKRSSSLATARSLHNNLASPNSSSDVYLLVSYF